MKRQCYEANGQTPAKVFKGNDPSTSQESVKVYCRLKPIQESEATSIKLISPTTLTLSSKLKALGKATNNYVFKQIIPSTASQQEVFETVALPLLENLINGRNSLLFTYGVTGSGKTFTITGEPDSPGIIPTCIYTLFNTIDSNRQTYKYIIKPDRLNGFEVLSESDALDERFKATKSKAPLQITKKPNLFSNSGSKIGNVPAHIQFAFFISYIEIYNNNVYDLLDENNTKTLQAKILREDHSKGMYVNGVVELEVKSAEEAFDVFNLGQMRKRMGNTLLNAESSRSHSIFMIRVVHLENSQIKTSQFSLVDLAGSERSKRTQTTGARLKEASRINNSLMTLRACLEVLKENQLNGTNRLVPYRDSRLTLLFKTYFEGLGQVSMVVCVNPAFDDYEENIQVLKFAEITQDVKTVTTETKFTPYKIRTPKVEKVLKPLRTPATLKAKKTVKRSSELPKILLSLENCDDNVIKLRDLITKLQKRKQNCMTLKQEIDNKTNLLRKRLLTFQDDNISTNGDMKALKKMSNKENIIEAGLQNKISSLEDSNKELTCVNSNLQDKIKTLQISVQQKNLQINYDYVACERSKQKLAVQSEKKCQQLTKNFNQQYKQLHTNMEIKAAKLQKVKDYLNDVSSYNPSVRVYSKDDHDYNPQRTPEMHRRNASKTFYTRRSRSVGDSYLEHNVVQPVPLGTLFQPLMKKNKTVNKLEKIKDVASAKQNRYCLVAQEPDTDGEIETRLYKGDIILTCGGGAQVVFDDIERLKQESPTKI